MSDTPLQRKLQLRTNLLDLSEACPFDHSNPKDCPLRGLRRLRPVRRLQWFDALTETDLEYLAAYHHVCYRIKVEGS